MDEAVELVVLVGVAAMPGFLCWNISRSGEKPLCLVALLGMLIVTVILVKVSLVTML